MPDEGCHVIAANISGRNSERSGRAAIRRCRAAHGAGWQSQIDDPVLPLWRRVADRHLGHEAERAGRGPRAVQADRHIRSRRGTLRALAAARATNAPSGRGQLGGRDRSDELASRVLLPPDRSHARFQFCCDGRRAPAFLPNAISQPWIPEGPPDIRGGQFAGRLGIQHDPLYVLGSLETPTKFQAPALVLDASTGPKLIEQRRAVLRQLDRSRRELDDFAGARSWQRQQERAYSLLTSARTHEAFDVTSQ